MALSELKLNILREMAGFPQRGAERVTDLSLLTQEIDELWGQDYIERVLDMGSIRYVISSKGRYVIGDVYEGL